MCSQRDDKCNDRKSSQIRVKGAIHKNNFRSCIQDWIIQKIHMQIIIFKEAELITKEIQKWPPKCMPTLNTETCDMEFQSTEVSLENADCSLEPSESGANRQCWNYLAGNNFQAYF